MVPQNVFPIAVLAACCSVQAVQAETPFACNLKALTAEQRTHYEQLTKVLISSVSELRELPDGYAFRLAAPMSLPTAAEWADLESKCCPFFDFHLERQREQGPLWLRLTGRPGVKQFIKEEFKL